MGNVLEVAGQICNDFLPQPILDGASWIGRGCSSIGSAAHALHQKVHNVFRSFLLSSLGWMARNQQKSALMNQVDLLEKKSYALFGSLNNESRELANMIAQVSALVFIAEEQRWEKEGLQRTGVFGRIHGFFFSALAWLEGENFSQVVQKIDEIQKKAESIWKTKNDEFSDLTIQGVNTKFEAQSALESLKPPTERTPS